MSEKTGLRTVEPERAAGDVPTDPSGTDGDIAKLAIGSSLNLVGSLISALAASALILVLTRGLGADGAGAFFEALAIFSIAMIVAVAGADTGLVRFVARFRALGGEVPMRRLLTVALVPIAVLGVVVGGLVLANSDSLGRVFGGITHPAAVGSYLKVLALFVPVGGVYFAVLGATRGFETMLPTVVVERIGRPVLQLAGVAFAVAAGTTAAWVAVGWGLATAVALAAALLWLGSLARRRPGPVPEAHDAPGLAKEFWSFTLPRALASIFRVAVLWFDVLLVGALVSPRAAGIYVVATRLVQFGLMVNDTVGQAIEPMFSGLLAGGHRDRTGGLYQVATGWVMLLTWPQYLVAMVFAPALLGVFGPDLGEGTAAVVILAASAMIGSALGPVDVLLLMAGKSTWSLGNSAVSLAVNVVLNLLLIPAYGLTGAAVAWAITRVVANLLPFAQVSSRLRFHPFGAGWRIAAVLSLVVFGAGGLAARALLGDNVPALLVFGVLATGAYTFLAVRYRDRLDLTALTRLASRRRPAATSGDVLT